MVNLTRLLRCFLWLMCLNGAAFTTSDIYTNIWAVKIRGSLKEAKQLASKYNFSYKMHLFDDYYIYKKPDLKQRSEKTDASMEIDKKLDLEPKVEWFEQQKEKKNQLLSTNFNDPLFKDQWYIERVDGPTYNMSSVWPRYTGSGILVAVVDDGVNGNQAEISPNYNASASYDFLEGDAIPVPSGKTVSGHGNSCAGVIAAAANNGICGVGLAYNAKIAGLRIYDENVRSNDAIESAALSYKLDMIDIYSNSWGPGDIGVQVEGPGPLTSQALERGTKTGRNGLGAIYTFAAGNGGITQDSCAYNGYVNSIYTIAINGVNSDGSNPSYAEECPGIMATTYSRDGFRGVAKVITAGKSSSQCDEVFSSTSAAAAMASGLIALTLEANPKLSWRDVQHVIVRSARSAPGGTPLQRGYWVTNKANLTVSKFYGFGLMDAGLMVHLAERWSTVPQQRRCEIRGQDRNRSIPSTLSVTFANCEIKFLEHVQVKIDLNFDRRGHLYLELEAPSGTKSPLTRKRRLDVTGDKNLTNWFITTLFNWGESPVGRWTLRIENLDTNYDNKGTLHSWSLILYGTSSDPLQNNTHVQPPPVLPTNPPTGPATTTATPSPKTTKPVLPTEPTTTGKQNPSTTTATPSPKTTKPVLPSEPTTTGKQNPSTTSATPSPKTTKPGKPRIPELLVILLNNTESKLSVALKWNKHEDNGGVITKYTIYMKEVKSKWEKIDDITDPNQLEFTITKNIVYGKTYMFLVTAWNKYGESIRDDSRAKIVNTTADTAIYTSDKSIDRCTEENSKCAKSTVLGVIIAILVLSLGLNVLQFIWLRRKVKEYSRKETPPNQRTTKANAEIYDNNFELDDTMITAVTAAFPQNPLQTGPEYESIQEQSDKTTSSPHEPFTSGDDPSHYQGLNLPPNISTQKGNEPIRTRSVESTTHHNGNEQHTYESLSHVNKKTDC